ncbi:MAG: carbohydrate ABC transporter permease [Devosia sp.]
MTSRAADMPVSAPASSSNWFAKIRIGRIAAHVALLFFVALWTFPTVGLLISSVRDKDQLAISGWWTALASSTTQNAARAGKAADQVQEDGKFVIKGNLLGTDARGKLIQSFGITNAEVAAAPVGGTLPMRDGGEITVQANGDYVWTSDTEFKHTSGPRIYYVVGSPPRFTLDNYIAVLQANGIAQSFINSITVAIPSTVIPIMIAAFAAYALAWMRFPGRGFIVAVVVGLLVVPLQMSLIPLLRMYNGIANVFGTESKGYFGVWLAHTAFGLPLAIYLLRNYMSGLPREIMESARIDGASHFKIFTGMVLPLSFPALASFAIFQFLWIWNDLLVALVFLGAQDDKVVLTGRLVNLLGTQGDNWELLTSGAFISIVVPLIVFFSLQRYFVRGLLAGSVK